jgi:hypothetical protein
MLGLNSKHVQPVKIYLQKVLTFWKFDEKKGNNSKLGTQINFKIAGYVDLNMLHMPFFHHFLAHLTQRAMWGIAITWRPSSVR